MSRSKPSPSVYGRSPGGLSCRAPTGLLLPFVLALSAGGGCRDEPSQVIPATGVIEVTALAEGADPLPRSFLVLLDGSPSGPVPAGGRYTIPSLPSGTYFVSIREEQAERCWYGENGRLVTVELNDTSYTTFLVRCR